MMVVREFPDHAQQFRVLTTDDDGTLLCQSTVQPLVMWFHPENVTVGVTLEKFTR